MEPVRFALVGLGGYARYMSELFSRSADLPNPPIKFVAACDPNLAAHPHVEKLKKRGVELYSSYEDILKRPDIEVVWLPVPIELHRPFVEMAIKAGKVPVVEKPVAGSVDDVAAMIAVRNAANGRAAVGFQDIYADSTVQIKRDLIAGAIGKVRSATVHACMPRAESYYYRNAWAGKIKHNGTWVLDSPANNAIAHFINLGLFFLGRTMPAMASLESVSAELYRVYDIENYDTCSLRVMTEGGVPMLVHFTHASQDQVAQHVTVHGDRGVLRYVSTQQATWDVDGQQRTVPLLPEIRDEMVDKVARWVRGDADVIVCSLEMAGAQLAVINGASEAAPVKTVTTYDKKPAGEDDVFRILPGIEALFARASAEQKMLHELGAAPWTVPARTLDLRNYKHFAGPAR